MRNSLENLLCEGMLGREEMGALFYWWKTEAYDKEELPDFLLRHNCISEAAPIILDMVADGLLQIGSDILNRLFSNEHRNRLCAKLREITSAKNFISLSNGFQSEKPNSEKHTKIIEPVNINPDQDLCQRAIETVKFNHGCDNVETTINVLKPGLMLGKYLLLEQIGQGAAGLVFRAHHQNLNVPVAIKILKLAATESNNEIHDELRREARLLAQINHPNVVRVWDYEDSYTYPFLVLEYVPGLSLEELIKQTGQLQAPHAIKVILNVCHGLKAALQVGIIHRDIKPANILVARDSSVKIADLGLAIAQSLDTYSRSVKTDGPAGTIAFMSPEQAKSAPIDHRSDIYSLGVTFYYTLTGRLPFTGSPAQVLMKHVQEMPIPPHQIVTGLDEKISKVVLKMMAKAPIDRYQTYDECISELSNCLDCIEQKETRLKLSNDKKAKSSIWETLISKFKSN